MNIIRLKGIVILLVLVGGICSGLYFFSGVIVKSVLESQLSSSNGAEVNIASVEITYLPLKMVVNGLEFTDKAAPAYNLLAIKSAGFELSTNSLFKGKFIVSDMTVNNIEFSTKRKSIGSINTAEDTTEDTAELNSVDSSESAEGKAMDTSSSLELPDIDELIANADLISPKAFKAVEDKAKSVEEGFKEVEAWLEDKKKWKSYEARFNSLKKTIKKGSFKAKLLAIKDLKKLDKEIKADFKVFNKQKKSIKNDFNELKVLFKVAKKAPKKDLDKIKASVNLDAGSIENLSRLLFDDEITGYLTLANEYYKKIEPYLASDGEAEVERVKGDFVAFEDFNPEPSFLIKNAGFTTKLPSGDFIGKATNIGFEQEINNKAAVISLKGKGLKRSKAEEIKLVLDFRDSKKKMIALNYDVSQRKINNYKIVGGSTLPLIMKAATLDVKSRVKIINGQLDVDIKNDFKKVRFISDKPSDGKSLSSMIVASMLKVNSFDVDVNADGKLTSPKFKVTSDIDNKINNNLKVRFKEIKKEYEKEIKKKFYLKYKGDIKKIEAIVKKIDAAKAGTDKKIRSLKKKFKI